MPLKCCSDKFPTIPEEEPVLILRGKDVYALECVDHWLDLAMDGGKVSQEKLDTVRLHRDAMLAFKRKYPERMHIPD